MEKVLCEVCGADAPRFRVVCQVADMRVSGEGLDEIRARELESAGLFFLDFCDKEACRKDVAIKFFRQVLSDRVDAIKKLV